MDVDGLPGRRPHAPFEPPPLPRGLLAGRASALEEKLRAMEGDAEADPARRKLEARLQSTRDMLRRAGGSTQRKLHFGMLDLDKKVERSIAAVARLEKELVDAEAKIVEATQARDTAVEALAAERTRLQNLRYHHGHLTLQAAGEANTFDQKYSWLYQSMQELQVALQGKPELEQALAPLGQVTALLSVFVPHVYDSGADPMLHYLDSDSGEGEATDLELADHQGDVDTFVMADPVQQAEADVQELKRQAELAPAEAVRAAAARAIAVVQGDACQAPTLSPADVAEKYAQRIQEAEDRLARAKGGGESQGASASDGAGEHGAGHEHSASTAAAAQPRQPQQQPCQQLQAAAPAEVAGGAASGETEPAARRDVTPSGQRGQEARPPSPLPTAFASAERAAIVPAAPEGDSLPAAFARTAVEGSSKAARFERRFPPAIGGPRGRTRSVDQAQARRARSRSGAGCPRAELDGHGDHIIGGA